MKSQSAFNIQRSVFIHIAGSLALVALFLTIKDLKAILKTDLRKATTIVKTTKITVHEFSYIKPFTALVRFNKKNPKSVETKQTSQKIALPDFPLLHLKLF